MAQSHAPLIHWVLPKIWSLGLTAQSLGQLLCDGALAAVLCKVPQNAGVQWRVGPSPSLESEAN